MEGMAGGGFSGRWVRTRSEEDAKRYLEEERMRARSRPRRDLGPLPRRLAWAAIGVALVVGVVLTLGGG